MSTAGWELAADASAMMGWPVSVCDVDVRVGEVAAAMLWGEKPVVRLLERECVPWCGADRNLAYPNGQILKLQMLRLILPSGKNFGSPPAIREPRRSWLLGSRRHEFVLETRTAHHVQLVFSSHVILIPRHFKQHCLGIDCMYNVFR